jgi:hypothetical protein
MLQNTITILAINVIYQIYVASVCNSIKNMVTYFLLIKVHVLSVIYYVRDSDSSLGL